MSSAPVTRIDHLGYVVGDLDRAGRFFVEALGATLNEARRGTLADDDGDAMTRRFGVHPRARAHYAFYWIGDGQVELMQWESPTRSESVQSNQDAGGRHIAVATPDMDATLAAIREFGDCEIREPNPAGFIYVKTPFGLEVQLIPVK